MKLAIIISILLSGLAFADAVYMQESDQGKVIVYQPHDGPSKIVSDSGSNWALYPDISPSGQEIVYVEGPNQSDLYLVYKNLESGLTQKFLPAQKGMLLHPKFTKNGKYIFYSAPGPKGKNTIYYFNRSEEVLKQGTNLTQFSLENAHALDDSEESYFPRPSSDGNFVVYQRNTNDKKEIVFYDRLENTKKVIAYGMSPSLSFDEAYIAYTSKLEGSWDIYVHARIEGVTFRATTDEKDEQAPTFMPDNTVAFASNKTGNYRLYKVIKNKWYSMNQGVAESAKVDFYAPQFTGNTIISQSLKANFIGNARSSFGTTVHEGLLYMAGGHKGAEHTYPPESFTNDFNVYHPETNSWKELAPRPALAHGYQIAAHGKYIYAFGGFAYSAVHKPKWKSLSQIDRYDIEKNEWKTIGHLKSPRSSNVAVKIDNKVYLAAGWDATPKFENDYDGHFHETVEIFDLVDETSTVADYELPAPKRRALTGIEHDGKLVLIGGLGEGASHFELLNKVTAIDPKTGTAQEMTPLPFSTFAPAAEILNGNLYVFGGMFKTGEMNYEYVSHIYGMNLESKKWEHTGRCLQETKGFSQVFKLNEGTLGILGGHHYLQGQDMPVSTFETFSHKTR